MKALVFARILLPLFALGLFTAPDLAEARTKVLQPVFVLKVSNATAQQTEAALRRALAGRHWAIKRDQGNEIEAQLNVRDHSVTVKFGWTATTIDASYVDSENMDYEVDGDKTYIDRYYYRWLKFIQRDVRSFSKRANSSTADSAADKDDDDTN